MTTICGPAARASQFWETRVRRARGKVQRRTDIFKFALTILGDELPGGFEKVPSEIGVLTDVKHFRWSLELRCDFPYEEITNESALDGIINRRTPHELLLSDVVRAVHHLRGTSTHDDERNLQTIDHRDDGDSLRAVPNTGNRGDLVLNDEAFDGIDGVRRFEQRVSRITTSTLILYSSLTFLTHTLHATLLVSSPTRAVIPDHWNSNPDFKYGTALLAVRDIASAECKQAHPKRGGCDSYTSMGTLHAGSSR